MHLFTCEMFECAECDEKSKLLSEMKKHALDEHAESTCYSKPMLYHIKMSKENFIEVSKKTYYIDEL